jgi:hypothetical protein
MWGEGGRGGLPVGLELGERRVRTVWLVGWLAAGVAGLLTEFLSVLLDGMELLL